MKKKLLATDYDGTFRRLGKVSKKDLASIEKYRAAGGKFGFVTGRGRDFFETAAKDGSEYDFMILYNGSLVTDGAGNVIREFPIPRDLFARLEKTVSSLDGIEWYSRAGEEEFYPHYYATFCDQAAALKGADTVNALFADEAVGFVNGPHLNIGLKGTGKAEGVSIALEYFGFAPDEAAVVGDDYNDIGMITAHKGWAVKSARAAVRKQASHVCYSVGALARSLLEDEEK